ncbi:TIGR04372 family glycosyltransferase [Pseudodesulfovibrio karagichevae]|uniref:TIGR04372 family glycosyltransferase n=1 Tax=Pseudodesulfovibrio karagichevae TaxID=3239305 RepID=A0ABV4JZ08_9BACT
MFNKLSPVPVKIHLIRVERIGHLVANQLEYFSKLERGLLPREYRFFVYQDHPSNRVMLNILKRNMRIVPALLPLYDVCRKCGGLGVISREFFSTIGFDTDKYLFKMARRFDFSPREMEEAKSQCRALGLDPEKPIVSFLGRDEVYTTKLGAASKHFFRNANVQTLVPAMEYLADRYQVVRLGSAAKEPVKTDHPNVLDYTFSGRRTELLDVYLSAKCRFFVSVGSGLDAITSYMFRLPVLYVHCAFVTAVASYEPNACVIFKKCWHKAEERYLTMSEIFEAGAGSSTSPEIFDPLGIEIHDNTAEEIVAAAREMVARVEGTWVETEETKERQERFWVVFRKYWPCNAPEVKIADIFLVNNPSWME